MNNCTDCAFCISEYVDKYRPYRRRFFCERRGEHLDRLTICSCFSEKGGEQT